MPTSPVSPISKRRRSSSIASSDTTPIQPHSRRSSQYSLPRRSSKIYGTDGGHHNRSSTSIATDLGSPTTPTRIDIHESLADELGEAWGEDEGIEERYDSRLTEASSPVSPTKYESEGTRDNAIDVVSSPKTESFNPISSSHSPKASKSKPSSTHSRKESRTDADPSKHENSTPDSFPPSLRACISEIEALARQGLNKDDTIDEGEEPIAQFLESIKNLGGQQANLETQSTRLITAHTSLSMHLAHQNRLLQSLAYYVLSPLPQQSLAEEAAFDLLPAITSALENVPRPTVEALSGLHRFFVSSNDLASSLSSISDSLHISRQVTSTANQRLKSAKELVAELRKEYRATEDGIAWIEDGHWARRLEQRECASVCKDVIGGFETACETWRTELAQSVGA